MADLADRVLEPSADVKADAPDATQDSTDAAPQPNATAQPDATAQDSPDAAPQPDATAQPDAAGDDQFDGLGGPGLEEPDYEVEVTLGDLQNNEATPFHSASTWKDLGL